MEKKKVQNSKKKSQKLEVVKKPGTMQIKNKGPFRGSVLWPFILGCCSIGRVFCVNVKELYDNYRAFSSTTKPILSFKAFEEDLKKALPFIKKEKRRPSRRMYFTGIMLRPCSGEKSSTTECAGKVLGDTLRETIKLTEQADRPDLTDQVKDVEIKVKAAPEKIKGSINPGASPVETLISRLQELIDSIQENVSELDNRLIPVSFESDTNLGSYPAAYFEKGPTVGPERSRIFTWLSTLVDQAEWITKKQVETENCLEI
jgi:hypothetical protein